MEYANRVELPVGNSPMAFCDKNMKVKPIKLETIDGRIFSLTLNKVYEVLGIEADNYRLLDDGNKLNDYRDPVLFEPEYFEIIDPGEPDFWVTEIGEEGERYCYPLEWLPVGFFEDFHNDIKIVKETFWSGVEKYYPYTWHEIHGK